MNQDSNISDNYSAKREQIIEAAENVFAYYGYNKTTLEDIANKVGMKKNSIYYYFKNKEDLLNEIISRIYKSKISDFEKRVESVESTFDKLKIFFEAIISPIVIDKKSYNVTPQAFIEIGRVIEESFKEFIEDTNNYLHSILREGIKKGELKKIDVKKTAGVLIRYMQAIELLEYSKIKSKFIDRQTNERLRQEVLALLDLVVNGIKK
ncbi:MAG: TetR/AcrR family transcriptional regulator [Melioribacteraceae bacterium]|jgi:AcrR family transcriptional regulator|nr:TetR/AcrR family transcriptional regulator [Melioribacteraceae bacterium]RJP61949.1 MAG: TetR/AcrR family transcriptional regulator [Ignavibacteriales bacterium]WKZ70219.1 MAG: TetR/AcrR family transcriptional regulator [Melioribacteraceae bacterium]